MKILFLDFDGVLNSGQFYTLRQRKRIEEKQNLHDFELDQFCEMCCSNLKWITENVPDLKIVISSSWRHARPLENLRELLQKAGDIPPELIIDKTPSLRSENQWSVRRGHEIQRWIDDNNFLGLFVIVDDDADMEHLMHRLVQTDARDGLTQSRAIEIAKRLGVRNDQTD